MVPFISVLHTVDVAASIFFIKSSFVTQMPRRSLLSCGLYKWEYTVYFTMTLGYSFYGLINGSVYQQQKILPRTWTEEARYI